MYFFHDMIVGLKNLKNTYAVGRFGAAQAVGLYVWHTEDKPKESKNMSVISMKQLLEAGVHFGHQTRRWNPKMAP